MNENYHMDGLLDNQVMSVVCLCNSQLILMNVWWMEESMDEHFVTCSQYKWMIQW